jgi:hypothetical protein
MLSNGLLFNYFFFGSLLVIWRQLIWMVGFFIFIYFIVDNYKLMSRQRIYIHFRLSLFVLVIVSVLAMTLNEYNLIRIIQGWMFYIFGYSFVVLPLIIIQLKKELSFFKFLTWLGVFISIGLIIDGLNYNIFSFLRVNDFNSSVESELTRATFLSEAATIFGVSQLLFMIGNIFTVYFSKTKFWKVFYFLTLFIFLAGGWYTGSRQVFFILLFTFMVYFIFVLSCKFKLLLILLIIPFILLASVYSNSDKFNSDNSVYLERFLSDTDGGNAARTVAWKNGINQLSPFNFLFWFSGNGFTFTMGQQALPGEKVGYHMESSVWSMFSECGLFSWYIFFWPWLYSIKLCIKMNNSIIKGLFLCFLISYIFTSFVSPNGAHPLSTMSLFIVLGFLISIRYSDNRFNDIIKRKQWT